MKKALTLFLLYVVLSLYHTESQAQHYQSIFGKQSTSWVFEWYNFFGQAQDTIFVEKDTVVNNMVYKKIIASTPYYLGGLLREDTIAGKVWYKSIYYYNFGVPDPNDTIERLAFDFSLLKGDTFDISSTSVGFPGGYPASWSIVDSVYFINGRKYIQFAGPNPPAEPVTLIEGIGGNYGIIWKHYVTVLQGHYLLCSYKDGVRTDYINKQYNGNCYINSQVGVIENLIKSKVRIFPNPAQNYFQIQVPEGRQVKQVSIVNAAGQEIKTIHHPGSSQEVSTGNLPFGFYFVKISLYDNSTSYHKIFIKH